MTRRLLAFLICSAALYAHPMGNFSVNHYSKLQVTARGVDLQYVLDLAEIPTFELLRGWQLDRNAPQTELDRRAAQQSREWLDRLSITTDGRPAKAKLDSVKLTIADGAGNLPIMRLNIRAHVNAQGGKIEYEDGNFPERAGWKEIVIDSGAGVSLSQASQSDKDISKALTQYPPDPTVAPPQDLRAELEWTVDQPVTVIQKQSAKPAAESLPVRAPVARAIKAVPQPRSAMPAPAPATLTGQSAPAGSVVRGDFLSKLLHQRELTPLMILLALAAAFGLGAAHALTPGHGKTIVAAYLVGSRGTLKHAAFLGAMVTLTHTASVFALGLATLFLFRYIVPEKITVVLGAISGLSIVVIGAFMLRKRLRNTRHSHWHENSHDHGHSHAHSHSHSHGHSHDRPHTHAQDDPHHNDPHHSHGGYSHSHVPDEVSWGALIALGASGGLVPCESALVLLLGAIALGRVGLGLLLLVSFSLGLALVLMTIGVLVLYAKNLLPEGTRTGTHPLFRWMSVVSPALVMIVGLMMTAVSLGWIQTKWMIG